MTKKEDTGLFADLPIAKNIIQILSNEGLESPTPIQHQVIPSALEGKDVIGIAQTGTGKTFAFGIPMIQRLAKVNGRGLVLVPTRELAVQVDESLRKIGKPLGLRTAVVIGGISQHGQQKALKGNPHIVVATPGRLEDLMNQGIYTLDKVSIIALDEADRMLDVGFLPNITRIMKSASKERQTLLFSATMPKSISGLASSFMKLPLRIEVAPQATAAENVEQEIFVIRKNDKIRLLETLLSEYGKSTILVFSRTKHGAKKIARTIRAMGHTATEIHGNRSQNQRRIALDGFANRRFRIMVATDIAARGIDVEHISLVINFDLPDSLDDYVHRIGRTGRAGRHGKAISFVTPSEKADVRRIERLINQSIPVLALPQLAEARVIPSKKEDARMDADNDRRVSHGSGRNSSRQSRGRYGKSSGGYSYSKKRFAKKDSRGSSSRSSDGKSTWKKKKQTQSSNASAERSSYRPKQNSDSREWKKEKPTRGRSRTAGRTRNSGGRSRSSQGSRSR